MENRSVKRRTANNRAGVSVMFPHLSFGDSSSELAQKLSHFSPSNQVQAITTHHLTWCHLKFFIVPEGVDVRTFLGIYKCYLKIRPFYPSFPCVQENWTGQDLFDWLKFIPALVDVVVNSEQVKQMDGRMFINGAVKGVLNDEDLGLIRSFVDEKYEGMATCIVDVSKKDVKEYESICKFFKVTLPADESVWVNFLSAKFPCTLPLAIHSRIATLTPEQEASVDVASRAFKIRYHSLDETLKLFARRIEQIMEFPGDAVQYFSPITCVIQSSGYGKSRFLCSRKETEDTVYFMAVMNCGQREQTVQTRFPQPSLTYGPFTEMLRLGTSTDDIAFSFMLFLRNLLAKLVELKDDQLYLKDAGNHFVEVDDCLIEGKNPFLPSVDQDSNLHKTEGLKILDEFAEKKIESEIVIYEALAKLERDEVESRTNDPEVARKLKNEVDTRVLKWRNTVIHLKKLWKTQTYSGKRVRFVFAFDEASHLVNELTATKVKSVEGSGLTDENQEKKVSLFRLTRRIFRTIYQKTGLVVPAVFLSTNARISNFYPSVSTDPSRKDIIDSSSNVFLHLYLPIILTESINCFVEQKPDFTFELLNSGKYMLNLLAFGRPLWIAYFRSCGSIEQSFALAAAKLNLPSVYSWSEYANTVAGRANKLDLEISGLQTMGFLLHIPVVMSSLHACRLVDSGMGTLWEFNPDSGKIVCGFLPEPILSLICASHLLKHPKDVLTIFLYLMKNGFVDFGQQGEAVAKIILLIAAITCAKPGKNLYQSSANLTQPVPLKTFLGKLGICRQVDEAALVQFSHWFCHGAKAGDIKTGSRISVENILQNCVLRNCALVFPAAFPGVDLLIPFYHPDGKVGCILVQVKNRKSDLDIALIKNKMEAVWPKVKCPRIHLIMDLTRHGDVEELDSTMCPTYKINGIPAFLTDLNDIISPLADLERADDCAKYTSYGIITEWRTEPPVDTRSQGSQDISPAGNGPNREAAAGTKRKIEPERPSKRAREIAAPAGQDLKHTVIPKPTAKKGGA